MALEQIDHIARSLALDPYNPVPLGRSLRLRISERKIVLFLGDAGLLAVALLGIVAWRFGLPFSLDTVAAHPRWFILLVAIWSAAAAIFGAYDLTRAAAIRSALTAVGRAAGVTLLVYLAIPYLTPPLNESRLTAGSFVLVNLVLVGLWRVTYATVLEHPTFRRRAAVVGVNPASLALAAVMRTAGRAEYDLLGFIATNGDAAAAKGSEVLGHADDLVEITRRWRVAELVLAQPAAALAPELVKAVLGCQELGIEIASRSAVYERLAGKVPLEYVDGDLAAVLPFDHGMGPFYAVAKRAIDLLLGGVGLVLTGLLYPLVALAHRFENPGPVLYRQVRLGQGGRPFTLVKFRTMRQDAEADGPRWARADDPRTTRVGRLLRRLHLDELPQALNVVRGEMSLVGPRPERPEFVADLEQRIPFYRARNALRPGVTGWAQVNFRYGSSVEDALVKLQFDLYYLKHMNLWLDLAILARTFALVATLRGH